ncbi:Maf family protein [Escherichia coli]
MVTTTFRTLTDEDIAGDVASGELLDKAGAYGIQGPGWLFCQEDKLQEDHAELGLPLVETYELLKKFYALR